MSDFLAEFDAEAVRSGSMEAPVVEQPRSENGQFAAVEEVEAVEEETVGETVDEPVEESSPILGKFKTQEDLVEAYAQLEKRFHERDKEVSEAKKLADEMAAIREQLATQQPAQPTYDPNEVSDWFDDNPTQIPQVAQQAIANGDTTLYQMAIQKWHEYNPVQAMEFASSVREQALKAEFDAKLAQATLPIQQQAQKAAADNAVAKLAVMFPEMKTDEFARVMQEEATNAPWLATVVATGDPAQLEQALRSLALMAKGRLADNLIAVAQKDGLSQQQANTALKQEAAVLSASSAPTREPATAQSAWMNEFENSVEFKKAAGLM